MSLDPTDTSLLARVFKSLALEADYIPRIATERSTTSCGVTRIFHDIENATFSTRENGLDCGSVDSQRVYEAVKSALRHAGLYGGDDRMTISAYHNPRLKSTYCLRDDRVDRLVRAGVTLVDQGNKKGSADHRLRDAIADTLEEYQRFGLRLKTVVVITSDSDFSGVLRQLLACRPLLNVVLIHNEKTCKEFRELPGENFSTMRWDKIVQSCGGSGGGDSSIATASYPSQTRSLSAPRASLPLRPDISTASGSSTSSIALSRSASVPQSGIAVPTAFSSAQAEIAAAFNTALRALNLTADVGEIEAEVEAEAEEEAEEATVAESASLPPPCPRDGIGCRNFIDRSKCEYGGDAVHPHSLILAFTTSPDKEGVCPNDRRGCRDFGIRGSCRYGGEENHPSGRLTSARGRSGSAGRGRRSNSPGPAARQRRGSGGGGGGGRLVPRNRSPSPGPNSSHRLGVPMSKLAQVLATLDGEGGQRGATAAAQLSSYALTPLRPSATNFNAALGQYAAAPLSATTAAVGGGSSRNVVNCSTLYTSVIKPMTSFIYNPTTGTYS